MEVKISAHVYAYYEEIAPTYRIWVNNNLYLEREFWPNPLDHYIEEHMIVEIELGVHEIILEKIRPRHDNSCVWIERVCVSYENTMLDIGLDFSKNTKQVIHFKLG